VIFAAGLLLVSSVVMLAGPRLLPRLVASTQRPLVGILAWQLASWSVLVGVLSAAALIVAPSLLIAGQLPAALESCLAAIGHLAGRAENPVLQAMAVVLAVGVVVRLVGVASYLGLSPTDLRKQM
jgi:hypothetical protein